MARFHVASCCNLIPLVSKDFREATAIPCDMERNMRDSFSYPLRGMSRTVAARYIGVGSTKFDEMVKDGRMPKPKQVDSRVIWDRWALDLAFTQLPDLP